MRKIERNSNQTVDRRTVIQAGTIGLGLGIPHLSTLRAFGAKTDSQAKSVIFIFLTGGISHHDSFDMKPEAPSDIRGEFKQISTRTPGLQICEHLPMLAQRSDRYTLIRSMETGSSGHLMACHMMFTGRLDVPLLFSENNSPSQNEWPSMPSVVTYAMRNQRGKLPPAAVLPQPNINEVGVYRPGQYAGLLGKQWEAWHIDIAAKCLLGSGACPDCFRFDQSPFEHAANSVFEIPLLKLPAGGRDRFKGRVDLLAEIEHQQRGLELAADGMDIHRQQAISVLAEAKVKNAFDVENADPKLSERYGTNKFGLSLLMAKRLVESGVKLVQVNLGKNSSWDTHHNNFVTLKNNLLPPMDQAVTALLDDLEASGRIDETLVVMAGEFGRTPKINADAGRDHWGPVNTVMFFGGGVKGGNVIGASDRTGSEVVSDRQTPENLAATIYEALGIPREGTWNDVEGRPHHIYRSNAIKGLYG